MLTGLDKQILNLVQTQLPVTARPFARLAEILDISEELLLERLRCLKDAGYIRRIGPFFDSTRIGYVGTLVALEVAEEELAATAQAINRYAGITHNYEREGQLNLWFTLIAPTLAVQQEILAEIQTLPGVKRLLSLPATKKYKVSVQFKLD